jgi:YgiT-type zinc finger domain-containing protein
MSDTSIETFKEATVTYTLEHDGKIVVIQNVPARVCNETGEQLFSPQTVERIHRIVRDGRPPTRTVQANVFEFAA